MVQIYSHYMHYWSPKTRCCVDNVETCVIHVQGPQLSRSIVPVLAGVVLLILMFFFITSGAGSNSESRF